MTPKEFAEEMRRLNESDLDEMRVHEEMDDLMCKLLTKLGYRKGVEIFNKTSKWYA